MDSTGVSTPSEVNSPVPDTAFATAVTSAAGSPAPADPSQPDKKPSTRAALADLIKKAQLFSTFLADSVNETVELLAEPEDDPIPGTKKRPAGDAPNEADKKVKAGENGQLKFLPGQPKLLTGAALKDYQITGVKWFSALHMNGMNGILADEMGTGKTIQTIAFIAHIRAEYEIYGPHLIVAPTSVAPNWVTEFQKFAPTIPVLLYQGTVAERKELRFNHLGLPRQNGASRPVEPKDLPVIICTYGIAINDQKYLTKLKYKMPPKEEGGEPEMNNMYECLIVDEAHRLKNMECRLIRSLREYPSKHRFLLTGTPLQNNLEELYSLLSFIMPDVFQSLDVFSKDFDFKALTTTDPSSDNGEAQELVGQLHAILKAFILRRLKKDVVKDLPLKKEYVISAPLTVEQKELYDAILHKTLHSHLQLKTETNSAATSDTEDDSASAATVAALTNTGRQARKAAASARKSYAEQSEEDFLDDIENGTYVAEEEVDLDATTRLAEAQVKKLADRKINAMSLRNILMQLRKVANHPDLLLKPEPHDPETAQRLVSASGKMLLLERLVTALLKDKRKILLFSQFTSMLDIIHDWAESIGQIVYRIDGTTKTEDRQDQMGKFNADWHDDQGGVCNIFLLSTRAGGVGVNLTGADTVILFDSDWNPQQDLQAMDRSHRIGQKNNVLVFRLITETVERKILERATAKRKLETLVIGSGDFKGDNFAFQGSKVKRNKDDTIANLALQLLKIEGEKVELAEKGQTIMSDDQINGLLDRSMDAMLSTAAWSAEGGVGVDVMETVAPEGDEDEGEPDLFGSLLEPDEEEGVVKNEDDTGAIA